MSFALVREPFGYVEIDPAAAEQIVELGRLDSEGCENPLEPVRIIARAPDGKLLVADVSGQSVVQVGKAVTFEDAATLAAAIIAGEPRVLTHPTAAKGLAIAFLAAWCMAGGRQALAQQTSEPRASVREEPAGGAAIRQCPNHLPATSAQVTS